MLDRICTNIAVQVNQAHNMLLNFRNAFDVYQDIAREIDAQVNTALGREGDFFIKMNCPACGFTVSYSLFNCVMRQFLRYSLASRPPGR